MITEVYAEYTELLDRAKNAGCEALRSGALAGHTVELHRAEDTCYLTADEAFQTLGVLLAGGVSIEIFNDDEEIHFMSSQLDRVRLALTTAGMEVIDKLPLKIKELAWLAEYQDEASCGYDDEDLSIRKLHAVMYIQAGHLVIAPECGQKHFLPQLAGILALAGIPFWFHKTKEVLFTDRYKREGVEGVLEATGTHFTNDAQEG